MGGNKAGSIKRFPVLDKYHAEFRRRLCEPSARLMIVGYSFADAHINEFIVEGVDHDLKLFIIDPLGVDVIDKRNRRASIIVPDPYLERLSKGVSARAADPSSAHSPKIGSN